MSFISLQRSNRFGGQQTGVSASEIKSVLHGTSLYSTESSQVMESIKQGKIDTVDIRDIATQLQPSLESKAGVNLESAENPKGLAIAAMLVAACGNNPASYLQTAVSTEAKAAGDVRVALADGSDFDVAYSTESFDNQNLLDHMAISIGLNYKIARQGPAMEMVYRTIPLTPETGGVDIEVPNLFVQNALRHASDGSESDFNFRRVIDGAIDYQVLNDQATALLPTHNASTASNFVAAGVVTPFDVTVGRRTVTTSAVLVNKTVNLFGLGMADQVARVGQADYTEALDRNLGVESVFMVLGGETIRFDTKGLPYSRFVKTPEQGARSMKLDFPLTTLTIDKNTKAYNGDALTGAAFAAIAAGDYTVRLRTVVNGQADLERGTVAINPGAIEVMSIKNALGEDVSLTGTAGAAIVSGLAGLNTVGWWPDARVTNTNHAHLGLMLNVRPVKERLLTRTRSPFFVPYPLSEDRDQTVMDWLTFAVGTYINNEGVGNLIGYHERLMRLTGGLRGELTVGDFELNAWPIEGIGRYLINPYIETIQVDVQDGAQATDTVGKIVNGQEVLINTLRSVAFDVLQKSGYENACRYMDGGEISKKWRVGLVTSRKIERFLTVNGDSRTLGAGLPFQLEADLDARLDKSIYMVMVRDGDGLDPLSAGALLLTPTLVSTISVTRDNRPRNEAVVQPRFQHYHLCPIVVKLEVEGVDELLKESLPFKVENTVVP